MAPAGFFPHRKEVPILRVVLPDIFTEIEKSLNKESYTNSEQLPFILCLDRSAPHNTISLNVPGTPTAPAREAAMCLSENDVEQITMNLSTRSSLLLCNEQTFDGLLLRGLC